MLARYTYKANSKLVLDDHWPIPLGQYTYHINTDPNGFVESITVEFVENDDKYWPKIKKIDDEIKYSISIYESPTADWIKHDLSIFQGAIGMYNEIDIDLENPSVEWVPENDFEREKLGIKEYSISTESRAQPTAIGFNLVARSAFAINSLRSINIPLSFFRYGRIFYNQKRYHASFVYLYLFVETCFGNGKYKKASVLNEFLGSKLFINSIEKARNDFLETFDNHDNNFYKLIENSLDCKDIISYLIDIRGRLFHHSMKSKSQWNPTKSIMFEPEAYFLQFVCLSALFEMSSDAVFSESGIKKYHDMCEELGVMKYIKIIVSLKNIRGEIYKDYLRVRIPTVTYGKSSLHNAMRNLIEQLEQKGDKIVDIIMMRDEEDKELYSLSDFNINEIAMS